jgi:hypothetical protein
MWTGVGLSRRTACCFISRTLMDRVAGAGLSGAKEAPGFRAAALQPRPPIKRRGSVDFGVSSSTVRFLAGFAQTVCTCRAYVRRAVGLS